MSYAIAKAARDTLWQECQRLGAELNRFPHDGPMGLVPDHVRCSAEYRAAKRAYDSAFARLRSFNARFVKAYATEIREERRNRRA